MANPQQWRTGRKREHEWCPWSSRGPNCFPIALTSGVRGIGPTRAAAFEEAARALTMAVTDPAGIALREMVEVACEAPNDVFLLHDWLNALIHEMATRNLVFGRFAVAIEGHRLHGRAWGELVDRVRHMPAVEPKGATLTALKVEMREDGIWVAQCIVDV